MSQRIPEIPKHFVNDYSHDLTLAQLAHVAYADRSELNAAMNGGFRQPEFQLPPNWRPLLDQPFGHTQDKDTGFAATVFREEGSGDIVIAYRGSDDAQDWSGPNTKVAMDGPILNTVLEIANPLGTPTGERVQRQLQDIQKQLLDGVFDASNDQFGQALTLAREVRRAYPDAQIEVTGHSLGGALAQVAAHTYDMPGRSFDAPGAANIIESEGYDLWLKSNGMSPRQPRASRETTGERQTEDRDQFINYKVNDSIVSQMTGLHLGDTDAVTALSGRQGLGDYTKYAGDKAADLIGAIPLVGKVKRLGDGAEWAQMYIQAAGNSLDVTEKHDMQRIVQVFSTAVEKGELQRWGDHSPEQAAPTLAQWTPAATAPALPPEFAPSLQSGVRDIREPQHEGHDAYREMQHKVGVFETQQRIEHGPHSDRLAASMLQFAVENRFHYSNVCLDKNQDNGHIQLRHWQYGHPNQYFDADLAKLSSQPIEASSQRLNEAVSKHYANPAPALERTREQAQGLSELSFDDKVTFARIRGGTPGHISDDHVVHAMVGVKKNGMNAADIGAVSMVGDQIRVNGRGEGGQRVLVDVTQPAPKLEESVEALNTLSAQQAHKLAQQQNNPTQDDLGPKGPRV